MPAHLPALVISGLALVLSITTAWLTLFRRGNLRMTQPALVGFLYDPPAGEPKIFFRALLYATGKRGHMIEGMYLRVRRGETSQNFNYWTYGETKALMIGSGLRVAEDGAVFNQHFLPPKTTRFEFLQGEYAIEVNARVVNPIAPVVVAQLKICLTEEHAAALSDRTTGVLFTWRPDSGCYHGSISSAPLTSPPQAYR